MDIIYYEQFLKVLAPVNHQGVVTKDRQRYHAETVYLSRSDNEGRCKQAKTVLKLQVLGLGKFCVFLIQSNPFYLGMAVVKIIVW